MKRFFAIIIMLLLIAGCAEQPAQPAQPAVPAQPAQPVSFSQSEKAEMLEYLNDLPMTDFTLPLIGGGEVSLDGLKGKAVVLNAMASWCRFCIQELPHLAAAAAQYSEDDVIFLGVQTFEQEWTNSEKSLLKSLAEAGVLFPIAQDKNGDVGKFMSPRGSIPITVVLDSEGIVRFVYPGALPDAQTLTRLVDFVLQYEQEF